MLHYPNMNPIFLQLGPIKIHWYGVMYLLGFAFAWLLALYRANKPDSRWNKDQVADFIFYCALGVILGGRIGYMLFYDFSGLLSEPLSLFKIWQGGMSFHGGLMGVVIALWLFARRHHKTWCEVADFAAPLVPLGLAAGRMGNFINGELWGRVTTMPWGMVFPEAGVLPRHPSQLYEFLFEGVLLFVILWWFSAKKQPPFAVAALFLLLYGLFRFVIEFFRQPDPQLGFVALGCLSQGQLLSIPMILIGAIALFWVYYKPEI